MNRDRSKPMMPKTFLPSEFKQLTGNRRRQTFCLSYAIRDHWIFGEWNFLTKRRVESNGRGKTTDTFSIRITKKAVREFIPKRPFITRLLLALHAVAMLCDSGSAYFLLASVALQTLQIFVFVPSISCS